MSAAPPDGLPVQAFVDDAAGETWLLAHADAAGLWLKIAKQGNATPSVTYAQALDVALCHGWTDDQKPGFDNAWFLHRRQQKTRTRRVLRDDRLAREGWRAGRALRWLAMAGVRRGAILARHRGSVTKRESLSRNPCLADR